MAPIVRTAILDDDLSGTVGTVLDNTWKQELYDQIDQVIATIQTTTSTGTQTDFALTTKCRVLRCNNASLITFASIAAGYDGQEVIIESVGAGGVDINDQAAALGTAANRVITGTAATLSVAAGGIARIVYDGTTLRWRVVGSSAVSVVTGTWTPTITAVTSASGVTYTSRSGTYLKIGKIVHIFGSIVLSSKGTLTGSVLVGGLPFGAVTANAALAIGSWSNMTTLTASLYMYAQAAQTTCALEFRSSAATGTASAPVQPADISNSLVIVFSGTYEAAS